MRIRVLGSPAGGGSPQWSCNCANCDGLRNGRIQATARTESSIAVTANGADWLLVNASHDILTKIRDTPDLQPARAVRDSGIAAVLLMDAQIDHVTGLIMLRERGSKLPLLATPEVLSDISTCFPITGILSHYCGVVTTELPSDGRTITIESLPGLEVQTVAIASKPLPCSPFRGNPHAGDNPGLVIQNPATGARVFYVPGLGAVTPELLTLMASCSVLLVDGTFWTEDEMITQGLSKKRPPRWATCHKAARAE
jgi:pyrroloquinoline quinone biosynthesis protein B